MLCWCSLARCSREAMTVAPGSEDGAERRELGVLPALLLDATESLSMVRLDTGDTNWGEEAADRATLGMGLPSLLTPRDPGWLADTPWCGLMGLDAALRSASALEVARDRCWRGAVVVLSSVLFCCPWPPFLSASTSTSFSTGSLHCCCCCCCCFCCCGCCCCCCCRCGCRCCCGWWRGSARAAWAMFTRGCRSTVSRTVSESSNSRSCRILSASVSLSVSRRSEKPSTCLIVNGHGS